MTTDEIDPRLLSDLRGLREVADDLRLDPPPLPDVRRRAGRRHRVRLARRATGGAVALVAAGVLAATLLPAPRGAGGTEPLDRVQLAGTVMPKPKPAGMCFLGSGTALRDMPADVLRLPDPAPAGFRLTSVSDAGRGRGCEGGSPALTAWHVADGSSRIDRRVQIYAGTPYVDAPEIKAIRGRCAHMAAEDQPGRCVTLVVGGRERPVWRWDSQRTDWGDGQVLTWMDGPYLWQLSEFGLDEAALTDFLAGIRTYADGVITGSLPGGYQAWQPSEVEGRSEGLAATYSPLRGDSSRGIGVRTSNRPSDAPFRSSLMHATGNSPAGQPRVVDVDGHQGVWAVTSISHSSMLVWSVGNDVSVSIVGPDTLSLDEALTIARSVRQVPSTDPRLGLLMPVCDLAAGKPLSVPCRLGEGAP